MTRHTVAMLALQLFGLGLCLLESRVAGLAGVSLLAGICGFQVGGLAARRR